MAPKTVSEIITTLTQSEEDEKQIVSNFVFSVNELYTHPRDEINKSLVHIKDKDIFLIREELARHCSDVLGQEKLSTANITINPEKPSDNLRKRYKADKCYDDLYILAISIKEQKPHKDLSKVFTSPNANNQQQQQQQHLLLSHSETSIIQELHTVNDALAEVRKENKDLKAKLNLVLTKLDKQAKLIDQLVNTESRPSQQGTERSTASASNGSSSSSAHTSMPPPSASYANALSRNNRNNNINNNTASVVRSSSQSVSPMPASSVSTPSLLVNTSSSAETRMSSRVSDASNIFNVNTSSSNNSRNEHGNMINPFFQNVTNPNAFQSSADNWNNDGFQPVEHRRRNNQYAAQSSQNDGWYNDGFQHADHRHRNNNRKPPVYGTRNTPTTHNNKRMAGEKTERQFSLFIGGVNNDFSETDLESYIKTVLKINVLSIQVNKINQNNRSYKVTVHKKDKDIMFTPSNWEESITIKPYRERNTSRYSNYNQNDGRSVEH